MYEYITILTHFQLLEYVSSESIIQKSALGLIVNALSQKEKMRQPSQGVKKGATPTKRSVQNAYRWDNGSIETVAHKTKLPALLLNQGQDQGQHQDQDSEVKALIMHPKCSQGHKCLQCECSANVSPTAENTRTLTHTGTNSHTHLASSLGVLWSRANEQYAHKGRGKSHSRFVKEKLHDVLWSNYQV